MQRLTDNQVLDMAQWQPHAALCADLLDEREAHWEAVRLLRDMPEPIYNQTGWDTVDPAVSINRWVCRECKRYSDDESGEDVSHNLETCTWAKAQKRVADYEREHGKL